MINQARLDAYDRQSLATINEHGWMLQAVFGTDDDPCAPFVYTVGLTVAGLPELIIAGLPDQTAGWLLNTAAKRSLGVEIKAGDVIDDIATVPFRVIDAPSAEVNLARHLYGLSRVTALQLVWPDDKGHYPGDPGWSLGDAQPLYL